MRATSKASALLFRTASPRPWLWLPLIVAGTAALVIAAGGGNAFWISVPGALLAAGLTRTRSGAAIAAGCVLAADYAAAAVGRPLPSPAFALVIGGASAAILVSMRERLRDRQDALLGFALSDALTGLANRRALLHRVEYEIARHARNRTRFAVLMLDLDGFKLVNDRFGHAAGDELLREVAHALSGAVREQDTVSRIGGDEFCVLAPETELAGALRLVERVEAVVATGVRSLGVSAGVALFPDDGSSPGTLLEAADQRLLSAKRDRRRGRAQRRAA